MSNVLVIFADDMRHDMLNWMPFVNGTLRAEGTTFRRAYCNVPICQPARVSLLTGQNAQRNSIYQNSQQYEWPSGYSETWGVWCQGVGVTTGAFGKMPNGYRNVNARPGWNTWKVLHSGLTEQESLIYNLSTDGVGGTETPLIHHMKYIPSKVDDFIVANAGSDWFAWWCPTNPHITTATLRNNPHPSSACSYDWYHHRLDLLTDAEIAVTTKPTWIETGGVTFSAADQAYMRDMYKGQAKECLDMDRAIAGLYATLSAEGLLATTTIIFCSDGGVFFGEQRSGNVFASSKDEPYEPAAHIPMIVRGPGFPAGQNCGIAVSLPDVTATVLDIFGAEAEPGIPIDGTSLLTLASQIYNPTRAVLYEKKFIGTPTPTDRPDGQGVITSEFKMVRWIEDLVTPRADFTANPTDEYEMYNLITDPREKTNLAHLGGAHLTKRNELEAILDSMIIPVTWESLFAAYDQAILDASPDGYWPMWSDTSGSVANALVGTDGTYVNSPLLQQTVAGIEKVVKFDGINQELTCPFSTSDIARELVCAIRINSANNADEPLVSDNTAPAPGTFEGTFFAGVANNSAPQPGHWWARNRGNDQTNNSIDADTNWHLHTLFVRTTVGNSEYRIDNVVGQVNGSGALHGWSSPFHIGESHQTPQFVDGAAFGFAIFPQKLTTDQRDSIYAAYQAILAGP